MNFGFLNDVWFRFAGSHGPAAARAQNKVGVMLALDELAAAAVALGTGHFL